VTGTTLTLAVAAVALGLIAAGCGGASKSFAITTGMTAKAVRAEAGRPLRIVRSNPRNPDCWAYVMHRAVCFRHGRVDYVGP
jgi:hypothetical protein